MNIHYLKKVISFHDVTVALSEMFKIEYKVVVYWEVEFENEKNDFIFNCWYTDGDDHKDKEKTLTLQEVLDIIKKNKNFIFDDIQVIKDYVEVYSILNNQMDLIIDDYSNNGWEIIHNGIKDASSEKLIRWYQIAEKIENKEVFFEEYEKMKKSMKKMLNTK